MSRFADRAEDARDRRIGGGGDDGSPSALRVAVLVPARDEEAALPALLDGLRTGGEGETFGVARVLVVDNGSTDATARVARAAGAEVVREPRPGYGRACLRGLRELRTAGDPPDLVAFLDADDHLAPEQLPRLTAPVERGEADLVLGARTPAGEVPRHAALGNWIVTKVLRGIYGWPGRDMGPFRVIRFPALLALRMDDPDYGWNVQMIVRALRYGLRVAEVPVAFSRRQRGRSKISGSWRASLRAGATMLDVLVRELVRSGPGRCLRGPPVSSRQSRTETRN